MVDDRYVDSELNMLVPARADESSLLESTIGSSDGLPPKSIVTIGEIAHFIQSNPGDACSISHAFAQDIKSLIGDKNARTFGVTRTSNVSELAPSFMRNFLLPKVSTENENGKLEKIDIDDALKAIRLNIVTHSFGERIAREAGNTLLEAMQDPELFEHPYSKEEAEKICKQVLVVGMGGALEYDHDAMASGTGTKYQAPDSPFNHVAIYSESESTIRDTSEAYPESFLIPSRGHADFSYVDAIKTQPELRQKLNSLINSDHIPDDASEIIGDTLVRSSTINDNPDLNPKLITLSMIEGVSIDGDVVKYASTADSAPQPILTISDNDGKITLDSDGEQLENLGRAMNDSPQLQHHILDDLNRVFTDRATIMARHQLEAKVRKGEIEEGHGTRHYAFEERIRNDMRDKEERKQALEEAKLNRNTEAMVFAFADAVPDGYPSDKGSHNDKNVKIKEDKRLLEKTKAVELKAGDTITIGGADHFQGEQDSVRMRHSMKFPAELIHLTGMDPDKFKALVITNDVKQKICDRYDECTDDTIAKYIVDELMIPKVARATENGLVALPIEQAMENMRINFATHSFGGKVTSKIMLELEEQMTSGETIQPPFTSEQAKSILGQVFQFDMGPSFDYNFASETDDHLLGFNPSSTRIQLYLRNDPDLKSVNSKVELGAEDIKPSKIFLLETPEAKESFSRWGTDNDYTCNEQHGRSLYIDSLHHNKPLVETLKTVMSSPSIDRDSVIEVFDYPLQKIEVEKPAELPPLDNTQGTPAKEVDKTTGQNL